MDADTVVERPKVVADEHLQYLDRLRGLGVTNMFGAGSWLRRDFDLSEEESRVVLAYWMVTFPRAASV